MSIAEKNIANDTFWLNLSAETIYATMEKRANSIKNLQALFAWATGLFTTSGIITIIFGKVPEMPPGVLWAFGIAFFLLTIGYMLAEIGKQPVLQQFNPVAPGNIQAAFSQSVHFQGKITRWAAVVISAGIFSLAIGILLLLGNGGKKPAAAPALSTQFTKTGNKKFLLITYTGSKKSEIEFNAYRGDKFDAANDLNKISLPSNGARYITDEAGLFRYSLPLHDTVKNVLVSIEEAGAENKTINMKMTKTGD